MSEPRLEDDIAIGKNQDCDECDSSEDDCTCSDSPYDTLEEMYDDFQCNCRSRGRYRTIIRGGHDGLYSASIRVTKRVTCNQYRT